MSPSAKADGQQGGISVPKKRRVPQKILGVFALLLVMVLAFSMISPIPGSWLIRFIFRNGVAVAPDNYEEIKAQVTVIKDLSYPSGYKSNFADIYFPKDSIEPLPVVLWAHGGAFVGGDKSDVEIYATALAHEGFAVVCMNYQLAPEAKYPAAIIQTGEAYRWLSDIAAQYPLDMERLVLAGDSAGAHIIAQFAAIQNNKEYAAEMAMEQLVPLGTLKALLLFCGPFDVGKISDGNNALINFLMNTAAWAYWGSRDWADQFSSQATIAPHITAEFPPAFISDGNTGSFESHARDLANVLHRNNVPVETYFISPSMGEAIHEYQFIMNTAAGEESFQKMLGFLNQYVNE